MNIIKKLVSLPDNRTSGQIILDKIPRQINKFRYYKAYVAKYGRQDKTRRLHARKNAHIPQN